MAFPTATVIDTTNLDAGTDSPATARADLYDAVVALNSIIDSENDASGVVTLDASGKLRTAQIPTTVTVTGNLNLQPSTGIVKIADLLRLPAQDVDDLGTDFPSPQQGDIVATSNGDAGSACLCMYDGSNWKVIALGSTAASS